MLNPFPSLLTYAFFAPTLLRIAVALAFLTIAWHLWSTREFLKQARFPVVGNPNVYSIGLLSLAYAVIGILLFVGFETQWAAIAGALGALKQAVFAKRYALAVPLSRIANIFILVICLSLLLLGAGAYAFDLPL